MKAKDYIKREIAAGVFPQIWIREICGEFYLFDKDDKFLQNNKNYNESFKSREAAQTRRSKHLDAKYARAS
jgi:hypothetical protein